MAKQYWLGDFYVDLTRNQITQNKQPQKLPPKALAVLTFLAQNAKKVVSHDELLEHVWPDTIVTPNTLQRSIAQLRKALDDGATKESIIKTHAKQGYSLECDVSWHTVEDSDEKSSNSSEGANVEELIVDIAEQTEYQQTHSATKDPNHTTNYVKPLILVSVIMVAVLSVVLFNLQESATPFVIKSIKPVTASGQKEFNGNYSPDGQYITFHRYKDKLCVNNIWAKNVATKSEAQLTRTYGTYDGHSISPNGETMVFIEEQDCAKPATQQQCFNLLGINFKEALKSPVEPTLLMECKHSKISKPVWLDNDNIVLLQKNGTRSQLISYAIKDNTSSVIRELTNGEITYFDFSAKQQLIALVRTKNNNQLYLEKLTPSGEVLSSNHIRLTDDIPKYRRIYPKFLPTEDQLIFSTGRKLYTLNFHGDVAKINLPLAQRISTPKFHSNGKQMLSIQGQYDSEIESVLLTTITDNHDSPTHRQSQLLSDAMRSITEEADAQFQPHGNLIAYESGRSGDAQIWLFDGNNIEQLTQFSLDNFIDGFDWASDGQSLLANSDYQLTQVFLDRTKKAVPVDFPVENLFHWQSESNMALANIRVNGVTKFAEIDLATGVSSIIDDQAANWATRLPNKQIVYTDTMYRFWREGVAEFQMLDALEGYGSDKRFVVKHDTLFGINKDNQLWAFSFTGESVNIMSTLPDNIDYLHDVNGEQALISTVQTSRKLVTEIVLE
ncbi:winged helix-turn-helix domain-containing protein [Thalassotalea fusca]